MRAFYLLIKMKTSGIYKISSPSGKFYIGSAVNISKRWYEHRKDLRDGRHHNKPLQNAFAKYGRSFLKFEVLIVCQKSELLFYEQRCIDALGPAYNTCRTAGSPLGVVRSAETRARMAHAKSNISDKTRTRMSLARTKYYGPPKPPFSGYTLEQRRAMSESRKGRVHSEETKAKIRANVARRKSPSV